MRYFGRTRLALGMNCDSLLTGTGSLLIRRICRNFWLILAYLQMSSQQLLVSGGRLDLTSGNHNAVHHQKQFHEAKNLLMPTLRD